MTVEIKRMWDGGPLREFSVERKAGWIFRKDGFAGRYVCESCRKPCGGVYESLKDGVQTARRWICSECRTRQNRLKKS